MAAMLGFSLASAALLAFPAGYPQWLGSLPEPAGASQVRAATGHAELNLGLQVVTFQGKVPPRWGDVLARHEWQTSESRPNWDSLVEQMRKVGSDQLLNWVNVEINRVSYVSDRQNWGVADYWATPSEFLERGGDCEDYAIAKYLLLREAGWNPSQMKIAISRNHAVLIVKTGEGLVVLDNRSRKPYELKSRLTKRIVYTVTDRSWSVAVG